MKKKWATIFVLGAFLTNGCSLRNTGHGMFGMGCTQEIVCAGKIDKEKYRFFEYAKDSGIVVPGLRQNFVPQGIACWEEQNRFFISGYFMPQAGSWTAALLAMDGETGDLVGEYRLIDEGGKECGGHFSGVAISNEDLYVTGDLCLYRVPLTAFLQTGSSSSVAVAETIPLEIIPGSCNYSHNTLWVCEHVRSGTHPRRVGNTDPGVEGGWMIGYKINHDGTLKPDCVFSVPDKIQGITVLIDGRVVLSRSYGRKTPSQIFVFQDPRQHAPDRFVSVAGRTVPLWQLEEGERDLELSAPPMAEGCCAVGQGVYVIFESAAYYYRAYSPGNTAVDPTDKIWRFAPQNRQAPP